MVRRVRRRRPAAHGDTDRHELDSINQRAALASFGGIDSYDEELFQHIMDDEDMAGTESQSAAVDLSGESFLAAVKEKQEA